MVFIDMLYIYLQSFVINPLVFLILDMLEQLGMHGHSVHEQCLNRRIIGDTSASATIGLHPVDENFHLSPQRGHKLIQILLITTTSHFDNHIAFGSRRCHDGSSGCGYATSDLGGCFLDCRGNYCVVGLCFSLFLLLLLPKVSVQVPDQFRIKIVGGGGSVLNL